MTTEWLSDDDGPVPLADVGEADEIRYSDGGENATQDSPAMRVFIAGHKHWDFGGFHRVGREACTGTCEVARERAHQRFIGATVWQKERPRALRKLAL